MSETVRRHMAALPVQPGETARRAPLKMPWWQGLWAPKGTPKEIVAKLDDAVVAALTDPVVVQRFKELGLKLPPREQQTPGGLGAYQREEIGKWWPIIKAMNLKAE